jgi:5-bromo-4-chloroindolyl phosphate hydrolysis protein
LIAAIVGWIGAVINNYINNKAAEVAFVPVPARTQIGAPTVIQTDMPDGRTQLVQQVLGDAATALQKLDNVVPRLRHPDSISAVGQIVSVGKRVMAQVASAPEKFNIAQRVFTYYCPESVSVAEALAKLENDTTLDISRIQSTQSILQKLSILFERTELELKADDNKALDIDLKLLDQSLQADLSLVKN